MVCFLRNFACAGFLAVMLAGCGGASVPFKDDSKDTAAFALSVKQVVLNAVEELKTSKQPADTLRSIMQTVSELEACPTGEHLSTYQQIHTIAADLLAKSENGRSSDLTAKLTEMSKLANTLPGEVTVVKETDPDR